MPRRAGGQGSRVVTYRTVPGSSRPYRRANVGECTAWVQTTLAFELEVRGAGDGEGDEPRTESYTVDTFGEHRGAVEPTLYLTPGGSWFRRTPWQEAPSLKPRPPLYVEVTQAFAVEWLRDNGYPVPGGVAPVEANARIRGRRAPSPEQVRAHHLWKEGGLTQAEIAREIERAFRTPYTQSQVSRAVKRVDDWLQAAKPEPTARRSRRTIATDPDRFDGRGHG